MIIICTQPALDYYAWQVNIFLHSIGYLTVDYRDVHVLFSNTPENSEECKKLKNKYPEVTFAYYNDTREYKTYIPSIKQNLMHSHFLANPWLEQQDIFHVDSDIVFTKPIDFTQLQKDSHWYTSDTVSYIGYEYILSKGRPVLDKMLSIADVSETLIKSNQKNSGGAQYYFKNVKTEYWLEVVDLSHKFYKEITKLNNQLVKQHEGKIKIEGVNMNRPYTPLQIWTAEMWAILWVAWKNGIQTRVAPELDFSWATDPISKWKEVSIFHNAGVVDANSGMFYKGDYISKSPKDSNLKLDETKASYRYYNLLKEVL